jgi:hypothetical protein
MEKKEISDKIDSLVADLKKSLMSAPYNQRAFFDKVKNWWQNITKGPANTANPYYFQNKFGSLGKVSADEPEVSKSMDGKEEQEQQNKKDEFELGYSKNESKITLKEYAFLSDKILKLSKKINLINLNENYSNNIKNLEIFKIIDSWAINFKKEIFKMLGLEKNDTVLNRNKPATDTPSVLPNSQMEFKSWIKNESNMQTFINIVNRVYDSPQYSQPLSVVSNTLENKGIIHSGKTGLSLAIRNKILAILKREIKQNKEENSVFVKNVWARYKNAATKVNSNESEPEPETKEIAEPEKAQEDEKQTLSRSDFEDLMF